MLFEVLEFSFGFCELLGHGVKACPVVSDLSWASWQVTVLLSELVATGLSVLSELYH